MKIRLNKPTTITPYLNVTNLTSTGIVYYDGSLLRTINTAIISTDGTQITMVDDSLIYGTGIGFMRSDGFSVNIQKVTLSSSSDVTGTLAGGNGGTGQSSYNTGDILYFLSGSTLSKLPIGSQGQFLMSDSGGTVPAWSFIDTSSITAGTLGIARGGTGQSSFTTGYILFGNGTTNINTDSGLVWDNTNKRLGIGTSPLQTLSVSGPIRTEGTSGEIRVVSRDAAQNWVLYGDTSGHFHIYNGANKVTIDDTNFNVAIGVGSTTTAKLEVQTTATFGNEALRIDQDDADQPFYKLEGTSAANTSNNLTTFTTGNSIQGFALVNINGTNRWVPFYDAPTS